MLRIIMKLLFIVFCIFFLETNAQQDSVRLFGYPRLPLITSIEDGSLPIKETDTTLIEIKIFSSGEGYVILGDKKGKLYRMNVQLNIETNLLGGETYSIEYETDYWGGWGIRFPMKLKILQPQESKKDVTERFIK